MSRSFVDAVLAVAEGRQTRIRHYGIGSKRIEIIYGDPHLEAILAAALPPPMARESVDLTVYAWTGGSLPSPPPGWFDMGPRGEMPGWNDGHPLLHYDIERRMLSLYDASQRRGAFWIPSTEDLPAWEIGAPFLAHLQAALGGHGTEVVHAAAIAQGQDALLLVGRGGSGKSTTALCALQAGWDWLADDYCFIGDEDEVRGFYRTAKVDTHRLERFSSIVTAARGPVQDAKTLLFLPKAGGPCRVKAVLAPTVTGQSHSRLLPMSAAEAFRALAPSTLMQARRPSAASARALAALLQRVPGYRLELGTDVPQLLQVLRQV